MRRAKCEVRRKVLLYLLLTLNFELLTCATARAQAPGAPTISDVRVEQEGEAVTDRLTLGLIETTVGMPLSIADVRESITHLTSLTRYEDVQVYQEPAAGGVRLRYVLFPIHAVDRVEFRGTLGLPEADLRRAIAERFGPSPPASRAEDVVRALQLVYRDRGYLQPRITPGIEITHNPDRASMVLQIDSGPRAVIRTIEFDAEPDDRTVFANTGIGVGQPYDAAVIQAQLQKYETMLRGRGFYEARATHTVDYAGNGAIVRVVIDRGPHVSVAFSGDPLPEADRDRLVPIRPKDPPTRICSRTRAARSRTTSTTAAIATRWPSTCGTRAPTGDRADHPLHDCARAALRRRRRDHQRQHRDSAGRSRAHRAHEGRRRVRAGDARRRGRRHPGHLPVARFHAGDRDARRRRAARAAEPAPGPWRRPVPIDTWRSASTSPKVRGRWSARWRSPATRC